MALDRVVERHAFPAFRKRFHGLFAEGKVDRRRVMALKPLTYMNESGRAVGEAVRFHRLSPADVFVLHDEIDLQPGKVRAKLGGGTAGHNGLRSIDSYIGPDFWRVRIGVGRPPTADQVVNYVLRNFAAADAQWLGPVLDAIAEALPFLLAGDAPRFMNDVARLTAPPKPPKRAKAPAGDDA
jgi:PTH1 family peptidyl-tRNA hydrolase